MLYSLISLDLSYNNLLYVTQYNFLNNTKLRILDLEDNNIKHFMANIDYLPDLIFLNLRYNLIKKLSKKYMKSYFKRTNFTKRKLLIKGNSIVCNCSLLWITKYFKNIIIDIDSTTECDIYVPTLNSQDRNNRLSLKYFLENFYTNTIKNSSKKRNNSQIIISYLENCKRLLNKILNYYYKFIF